MTELQKKRAERLKSHPDTVTVDLHGEERLWWLGKYAMDLAKERGVRLQEVIGNEPDEEDLEAGFEQMCKLLWFGFLPFAPDVEVEDFAWVLSFGDIERIMPQVTAQFGEFLEEEAAQKKRSAQGKADRKKGRS